MLKKYYGNASRPYWEVIYKANKDIIGDNPNIIKVGQSLVILDLPADLQKIAVIKKWLIKSTFQKYFKPLPKTWLKTKDSLNQADSNNHDHGDNMVEIFNIITAAMDKKKDADASAPAGLRQ